MFHIQHRTNTNKIFQKVIGLTCIHIADDTLCEVVILYLHEMILDFSFCTNELGEADTIYSAIKLIVLGRMHAATLSNEECRVCVIILYSPRCRSLNNETEVFSVLS